MFKLLIKEAYRSLIAHRLRSTLTMLGLIIGVWSVVALMSIGQGVQVSISESIATMGSNLIVVSSGTPTQSGMRQSASSIPTLTLGDLDAVSEIDYVDVVAPIHMGTSQIVFESNNWNTQIIGTTNNYLRVRDWNLNNGNLFSDSDLKSAGKVVIIGKTIEQNLFNGKEAIGQTINIKNQPFLVVGVLDAKGQSIDGRDQDDLIIVPIKTAQKKLFAEKFPDMVRFFMVKTLNSESLPIVEENIKNILKERHKITEGKDDDFIVNNLTAIVQTAEQTTAMLSALLIAIASISLIVGGIGIMNIMLVSVSERTREIGIRMALGAKPNHILIQFLLEAFFLSFLGCFIGLILGVSTALIVSYSFQLVIVFSLGIFLITLLISLSVGIFFGYYPAKKASQLEPIDALRSL